MNNVILIGARVESPVDAEHRFVCIGPNCWGASAVSADEARRNCAVNASFGRRFVGVTRVVHQSFQIDPVDGSVTWDATHDAAQCPRCTVGKGILIQLR